MAVAISRTSLGKTQSSRPESPGVRTPVQAQISIGRSGSQHSVQLPVALEPFAIHQEAVKLQQTRPNDIVAYFESYELIAMRKVLEDRIQQGPGRPDALGGPILQLPENTFVQRASQAFFRGLFHGAQSGLATNPDLLAKLNTRMAQAALINCIAPPVFVSGAAVGVVGEFVNTIAGIYGLVTDFDQIVDSMMGLLTAIFEDLDAAEAFGRVVGQEVVQFLDNLASHGAIRFTFELGRLIGPTLIGAALALTGVGASVTAATWGARFFKVVVTTLRRFPKIRRKLDALLEIAERAGSTNRFARFVAGVGTAARKSGMTQPHVRAFQEVAQAENRIIAVRWTNPLSTQWIQRGFPGKPMFVKVKTSKKTGIVTVTNKTKQEYIDLAYKNGCYIIDEQGVPRNQAGQALEISQNPGWPVEPGQVIDPRTKKPFVGDYDLHSVIDPDSSGRNIVLAAENGQSVGDVTNPETRRIAQLLNNRMDQPRVLHGAHDGFGDLASAGNGTIVFQPDGSILVFEQVSEMEDYFGFLGRATIKGQYESAPLPAQLPDNVIMFPGAMATP